MAGAGEYDSHAIINGTIRLAGGPRAPLVLTPLINFRYIYKVFEAGAVSPTFLKPL